MREQEQSQNTLGENDRRRVEQQFPESEDERLSALLVSFNMGPKAVTQLLLPYIGSNDLARNFREIFMGTEVANFDRHGAPNYCLQTLCPIGLVAQEYTIEYFGHDELVGFGLTEAGAEYGVPGASLLVYFEKEHKQSLYPTFGHIQTVDPEQQRAPYTRAKILLLLAEKKEKMTEAEIAKELQIGARTAGHNLTALANAKAIDYKAVTLRTGKVQLSYVRGELPILEVKKYRDQPRFTMEVVKYCEELINEGKEVTQDNIFRKLPQETIGRNEESARHMIRAIFSTLSSQGYLQRKEFKGGEIQSVAQISDIGRAIVSDFLTHLIGLVQDDSATRHWLEREIVPQVRRNLKSYAQNSGELYYPHSQSFKIKQIQENIARVGEILSASSKQLTVMELSEMIGVDRHTIVDYLKKLPSEVQREERKGVFYYSIKPTEQQYED